MRTLCLLLTIVCAALVGDAYAQVAPSLTLVQDGQGRAVIVLPSGRTWATDAWTIQTERHAAQGLQGHLAQMSGAKLPIVSEADLGQFTIVQGRVVPEPGKTSAQVFVLVGEGAVARALGVTSEGLKPGGIRVRTLPNALVLVGHPKLSHPREDGGGVRQAVVTLLESLGCRFLWPGESGRVVPNLPTVAVAAMDISYSPPIQQRRIRPFSLGNKAAPYLAHLGVSLEAAAAAQQETSLTRAASLADPVRDVPAEWLFTQWHGLGGDIGLSGGHAFGEAWDRWGKDHPEWFALQPDGTRDLSASAQRSQFCTSNLELIQAIADDVLAQAQKLPPGACISVDFNDGGYCNFCQCENCRKLDPPNAPLVKQLIFAKVGESQRQEVEAPSLSDRHVWFWNQISDRVTAVRPDLRLGISAYSIYSTAPVREKLRPNLVLRYVPHEIDHWDGWRTAGAQAIYWRPNIYHSKARQGVLRVQAAYLVRTFSYLFERGLAATDIDSLMGHWSTAGINYYAGAKLNWNPHLTYEQILDHYCSPAFGSAAEPMKQYFRRAEEITSGTGEEYVYIPLTESSVQELRGYLSQADTMAGQDAAVRQRIAFIRRGLNYSDVYETLERITADAKEKKPFDTAQVQQLLALNYLTLREIALHEPQVLNAAWIIRGTGTFAYWEVIRGRNYKAPDPLIAAVDQRRARLTGSENSIADMLSALGITSDTAQPVAPAPKPAPPAAATSPKKEVEADEQGRAQ